MGYFKTFSEFAYEDPKFEDSGDEEFLYVDKVKKEAKGFKEKILAAIENMPKYGDLGHPPEKKKQEEFDSNKQYAEYLAEKLESKLNENVKDIEDQPVGIFSEHGTLGPFGSSGKSGAPIYPFITTSGDELRKKVKEEKKKAREEAIREEKIDRALMEEEDAMFDIKLEEPAINDAPQIKFIGDLANSFGSVFKSIWALIKFTITKCKEKQEKEKRRLEAMQYIRMYRHR
jgi:hypothetical protein